MSNQKSLLPGEVLREISNFVIEFEITAKDVDAQMTITDTMLITSNKVEYNVEKVKDRDQLGLWL